MEQVGAEDGGEVQRRHLVPCDLNLEKEKLLVFFDQMNLVETV